ncbi:MAG: hypothetical protein ACI9OJ_000287 [Myxococcota bacterium]|jgi:hypothetical protein
MNSGPLSVPPVILDEFVHPWENAANQGVV